MLYNNKVLLKKHIQKINVFLYEKILNPELSLIAAKFCLTDE